MSSSLGWLAHDEAERRRIQEVIDLFRERRTLDELGIGSIRDAFADHLFPGTSTIQTRARYFLFIPWTYRILEEERVPSARAGDRSRALHTALVGSLLAGGMKGSSGLIGIEAGDALVRLPRDIYWYGLGRWGIRLFAGSVERYHASLDATYHRARLARTSDGGEPLDPPRGTWLGSLPGAPSDLLTRTTFALSRDEADFLAERIRHAAPASLLAACVREGGASVRSATAPWAIATGSLPALLRTDLEHARRFSLVIEGAVLAYHRLVARAAAEHGGSERAEWADRIQAELVRWAEEMAAEEAQLRAWDLDAFWQRLREVQPGVSQPAWEFARAWIERAVAGPGDAAQDPVMVRRIRHREHQTKGALARLHNARALERWAGGTGAGRLTYRWETVRTILGDIRDGAARGTAVG